MLVEYSYQAVIDAFSMKAFILSYLGHVMIGSEQSIVLGSKGF
jgi:hypothetical protein